MLRVDSNRVRGEIPRWRRIGKGAGSWDASGGAMGVACRMVLSALLIFVTSGSAMVKFYHDHRHDAHSCGLLSSSELDFAYFCRVQCRCSTWQPPVSIACFRASVPPALQCTCFRRYLSLLLTSRLLRRTLRASCAQLIIVSFLHLSVPLGFTITFAVGFGAVDRV